MFQRSTCLTLGFLAVLSLTMAGSFAHAAQVPPDATPGAEGVNGVILGGIDPVVAPGYRLVLAELVFEPGAYASEHFHPTAIVFCVQSGTLGFAIQEGTAAITRDGAEEAESLDLNTDVMLEPRDCVAFDQFANHASHTGWNPGDEPTVLWEARLLQIDTPFTTFVDEHGTPVP